MNLLPPHSLDIPPLPEPRDPPAISRPDPAHEPDWLSLYGRGAVEYGIGGPRSERTLWGRFLLGLKRKF